MIRGEEVMAGERGRTLLGEVSGENRGGQEEVMERSGSGEEEGVGKATEKMLERSEIRWRARERER